MAPVPYDDKKTKWENAWSILNEKFTQLITHSKILWTLGDTQIFA